MITNRRNFIVSVTAVSATALNFRPAAAQTTGEAPLSTDADAERRRAANAALIERYAAAWRSGDLKTLVDCYHEAFTLHYFGSHPLAGAHAGKPAALKALAAVSRKTNRRLLAIVDLMASPERAALIAREAFERDAEKAELERLFVYTTLAGRLHECWIYDSDQRLVDRFLS